MSMCRTLTRLFLFASTLGLSVAKVDVDRFDDYIVQHGRNYKHGSEEYWERRTVFRARLEEVTAQNARPNRRWIAGLNHLTDRTQEELDALKGYRPGVRPHAARNVGSAAVLEVEAREASAALETVDWRNLSMAANVYDQGRCGSCWAVATVTVLEAHYEIAHGKTRSFSAQELISCVKNPHHCGGKGGCDGATVELALKWAIESGLEDLEDTPYEAKDLACKKHAATMSFKEGEMDADGRIMTAMTWQQDLEQTLGRDVGAGGASFGLTGFATLETNKEAPLVRALVEQGPVAIAVAANSWFPYESGLFDSCASKDWVVNHAVSMFGYGRTGSHDETPNQKYWLIRNSWGSGWGEKGFIRMVRSNDETNQCGTDKSPQEGVACDGGPPEVTVCGTCGILYDSVVPHVHASAASKAAPSPPAPPASAQDPDDHTAPDPTGDEMRVLRHEGRASAISNLAAPAGAEDAGLDAEARNLAFERSAGSGSSIVGADASMHSPEGHAMQRRAPIDKLLRREAIAPHHQAF